MVAFFWFFIQRFLGFCFQLSLLNLGKIRLFKLGLCWNMGEMWKVGLKSTFLEDQPNQVGTKLENHLFSIANW